MPEHVRIRKKIWPWQTEKLRQKEAEQNRAIRGVATSVPCGGCNQDPALTTAYRCCVCGLYFCKLCALNHFGLKVAKNGRVYRRWEFWRR